MNEKRRILLVGAHNTLAYGAVRQVFVEAEKAGTIEFKAMLDDPPAKIYEAAATWADFVVAVKCHTMLPQKPHHGTLLVMHDGLVPAYRGCSPLSWMIRDGAYTLGVCLLRAGLTADSGPVIRQETIHSLHQPAMLEEQRLVKCYERLARDVTSDSAMVLQPFGLTQDSTAARYCTRLTDTDRAVSFRTMAPERVRNVAHSARTAPGEGSRIETVDGQVLGLVAKASLHTLTGPPIRATAGTVCARGRVAAYAANETHGVLLRVDLIETPDGKEVPGADVLRAGMRLK